MTPSYESIMKSVVFGASVADPDGSEPFWSDTD